MDRRRALSSLLHFAVACAMLSGACTASSGAPAATTSSSSVACDPSRGGTIARAPFTRYTVDDQAFGPSFVDVGDVDGDGRKDLVVSQFGPTSTDGAHVTLSTGRVVAYLQGDSLGCWHEVSIIGPDDTLYFPNRPTVVDVDGDGDGDVILPAGFFVCAYDPHVSKCGALVWFENLGGGAAWKRHDVVSAGDSLDYTSVQHVDFDGDSIADLVTVGEGPAGAKTVWFKGTMTTDRFDATPLTVGDGGGSFPVVQDVDGDGDLDVAAAEYFVPGSSVAWFERTTGTTFVRHLADASTGKGFQLAFVPSFYGDGVTRAVATNHTNTTDDASAVPSGVFVLDVPADPTATWRPEVISSGIRSRASVGNAVQGAPGVFGWGDIDGDGDIDLALAGDGDARTFWLEQTAPGSFETHVIEDDLGQASGALVVDLDGDSTNELVFTGYEDDAVYVYARPRAP